LGFDLLPAKPLVSLHLRDGLSNPLIFKASKPTNKEKNQLHFKWCKQATKGRTGGERDKKVR